MGYVISKEAYDEFVSYIKAYEPYPLSVLDDLMLDDNRYDDLRYSSTMALKVLLDAGYSEDEVNPWKKHAS